MGGMYDEIVFVFGSNLAGRHGKGAALDAKNNWGARTGVGRGRTNDAYALPTKDENLKARSLNDIKEEIKIFLEYARKQRYTLFLLTPIGTGLAGYSKEQMRSLLREFFIPENVAFASSWHEPYKMVAS